MAAVTIRHQLLESIPAVPYQYTERLGGILLESIATKLEDGERARILAALLHSTGPGVRCWSS